MRNALIFVGLAAVLGIASVIGVAKWTRRHPNTGSVILVYEIKTPPGSTGMNSSGTLGKEMAAALEKRVDPQGILNIVWRPVGNTRLEIVIPRPVGYDSRVAARKTLSDAQEAIRQTNVDAEKVKAAIATMSGPDRDRRLAELAAGSSQWQEMFASLARAHDEIVQEKEAVEAAKKAGDRTALSRHEEAQARAEIKYEDQEKKLAAMNLTPGDLQAIFDLPDAAQKPRVDELKATFIEFPARLAAIDTYAAAYDNFRAKYKGVVDDVDEVKRLLRGSGVLEFHIVVTDLQSAEPLAMIERLKSAGPAPKAEDTMRWFVIDNPADWTKMRPSFAVDGDPATRYALAYVTPDKQMVHARNAAPWALDAANAGRDQNGGNIVEFQFDTQGAKLFSQLTRNNIGTPLAIILDDRIISAPNINSEIGARGNITGGGAAGFSLREQKYLANTLSAGSLPAALSDEPISERSVNP